MKFNKFDIHEETIVHKTSLSFVFVNLKPFLPYHLLVSPIRIVHRINDLTDEEVLDLSKVIHKITKGLKSIGTGWTISLQDGKEAGQTVEHVHYHVIPRNVGDLKRNDDIYSKIDESYLRRERTAEEMKTEAKLLRNLLKENGIDFE